MLGCGYLRRSTITKILPLVRTRHVFQYFCGPFFLLFFFFFCIFLVVFSVIPFEFCFVDLHTISCLVGPSVHVSFVLLDSSLYVGGACTRFTACLVVLVFKCAGVMHVVVRSIVAFDT